MTVKIGVVMDPIENITPQKDTTLAILLAAQARDCELFYMTPHDLLLQAGTAYAQMTTLTVEDNPHQWYTYGEQRFRPLHHCDILLMRKDPPYNQEYIFITQLLDYAARQGSWVVNDPQMLRDANEKLFACQFPQCCPETLVTRNKDAFLDFLNQQEKIVCKPLTGMGGQSIFVLQKHDPNAVVVYENLTRYGQQYFLCQRYIQEATQGDKRILLIDGKPVPNALARVPQGLDFRGNLAAGAIGEGRDLTDRDHWICQQLGPTLQKQGLAFVGIDVIGDYLTEINITSPTGVRELDKAFEIDIGGQFVEHLLTQWQKRG